MSAPVHEIHAWIAIQRDGSEGIMSADLDLGAIGGIHVGKRHMPLLSGRRDLAERMGVAARRVQEALAAAGEPVTIELRTYRLVTN